MTESDTKDIKLLSPAEADSLNQELRNERAGFSVGAGKRKRENKVVIAHLSDLHFSRSTDTGERLWKALLEDLQQQSIDLLVITGDLSDSSTIDACGNSGVEREFHRVTAFLRDLAEASKIDPSSIMLVPGNHDFRKSGFLGQKCKFDFFIRLFHFYYDHRLFPNLGLCVFAFNSNGPDRPVNFDGGMIHLEALDHFARVRNRIAEKCGLYWKSCTRIALVHHHPVAVGPIGSQSHAKIDPGWFNVVKHSGCFMSALAMSQIDLVLHGHKHYAGYSRTNFPFDASSEHSVSVVASGSVGKVRNGEPSYNLVTVHSNGEIILERRLFRGSTYSASELGPAVLSSGRKQGER
jgi:3',5'-cyclic AMP phosphodiesterase CpdA